VDVSILGAMEVSEDGDLGDYSMPGKLVMGIGGAMDIVSNPELSACSSSGTVHSTA
jgi:3-oxoacid CoA-transferase